MRPTSATGLGINKSFCRSNINDYSLHILLIFSFKIFYLCFQYTTCFYIIQKGSLLGRQETAIYQFPSGWSQYLNFDFFASISTFT